MGYMCTVFVKLKKFYLEYLDRNVVFQTAQQGIVSVTAPGNFGGTGGSTRVSLTYRHRRTSFE